jgi:hypothetical protein
VAQLVVVRGDDEAEKKRLTNRVGRGGAGRRVG